MKKKVLLIVIDALTSRVLGPAIDSSQLPNIQALAEVGSFDAACTSIFPSITHAATASIATGQYPRTHGIAGAHWYDIHRDDPVYFGDDFWVIMNRNLDQFFEDFAIKLNHQWLRAETIYQTVERAGLEAACLNYIIFRGDTKHSLDIPQLLSLLPGLPSTEEVYGPAMLCMGDFVTALPETTAKALTAAGGLRNRFGFEDDYTADLLIQLAQDRALPDFTLAYFPDNDDQSHKVGPEMAVTTLQHLDNRLGELFSVYGGLEPMLHDLCLLIVGDHAQSDILADKEEANIQLDNLLADFNVAEAGQPWGPDDDLVICPNLRMAQIYFKQPAPALIKRVNAALFVDPRIDQVFWQAGLTDENPSGYHVLTARRGKLQFWPGNDGEQTAVDQQGHAWSWTGDLSAVDGEVTADQTLLFPDYPNAFERISGGLDCRAGGHLWLTAKPDYEFSVAGMSIHAGGGSHGSLHALDSRVPLLVAGLPDGIDLPHAPRIVDVAPLALAILGL